MTAAILSCEKDVGRTTDTEAVSMLLAAAEHDYTVESVGRILKSGSTDYNIIFGEHPVIDTYKDIYPEGIYKITLNSYTDGITKAEEIDEEFVFSFIRREPIRLGKTKKQTGDTTSKEMTVALRMLVAAEAAGYTLDDAGRRGDVVSLSFERHPVIEEYIKEHPEGIERLELSVKNDGITAFREDRNTELTLETTAAGKISIPFHKDLKITPLDSTKNRAFSGLDVSIRYLVHNESNNFSAGAENAFLTMSEHFDTLTLSTRMPDTTLVMTIHATNGICECRDTAIVKPYSLKTSTAKQIEAGNESQTIIIDIDTDIPEDMLIMEWEGNAIEDVSMNLAEESITVEIPENITIENRYGSISLAVKDDLMKPLEWTVTQGFVNEKKEGYVWFEDERFRSLVVSLHDTDGDNQISYAEAEAIEHLDASARDISSLTGVEKMCNLRSLDISGNRKLHSKGFLDLSDPHYHLTDITIDFLNEADFSGCPAVVWLHDYGQITKFTGHNHQTIKQQEFNQTRMHHVSVEDTYISTDLSMEGERVYLQRHTRGEGIEILLNYYGFADIDYKAGIMERTGRDFMEELFSKEPFRTFRDCFDFICIKHVSPGRGDNIRHETGYLPQVIGYSYDQGNPERPVELNIVNLLSTTSTPSAICLYHAYGSDKTFTHEFGHRFANLGDEYVEIGNEDKAHPFLEIEGKEYFGLGGGENTFWTLNTCLTNDPEKVPWRRFMKLEQYKDEVGIFEGAELFGKGAYRATERSLMGNHNTNGKEFNPPSRYSIFQEIMRRSEILGDLKTDRRTNKYPAEIEQMLWKAFLEYDKKNL